MKRIFFVLAVLALVSTGAASSTHGRAQPARPSSEPNAVLYWSQVAESTISVGRPPASSEVLNGLVHAAIYDAVVSVQGEYEPFAVSIRRSGPTSVDAAVAAAARGVLVARVPGQASVVEDAYATFIAGIPDGMRKTNGIRLGQSVAGAYLALRSDDGFDNVVPWVQPPPGPGVFEPIPFNSTPVDIKLKQVQPLAFDDNSRFRPDGPNALTSRAYTRDFNEVKRLGRIDSSERTPEQTETARFWTEQAMVFFNRNLRNLAAEHGLDTLETARMLAMVHVSAADSLVGCWEAKFHYLFWRPQTAIQRADTDGNPDTIEDPTWTHLVLGNHPEYPSGHACFTAAVTRALKAYFGTDHVPWAMTSTVTGTTHSFDRLSQIRAEVANARVWGGLHFRNSTDDGDLLAKQTTHYVLAHNFHEADEH
jgi:VCPO second helical-bundle domain